MTSPFSHQIVSRSWNGTPISRRSTDGYVNATAMCKSNGKAWTDYWRLDRSTEYLEVLSAETGISVSKLCLTTRGGAFHGTWVHPQVAVDLARWISAPFAVWMDRWFLESLQQPAAPASEPSASPRLHPSEMIGLVERTVGLFQQLGGLDERDQILFKDIARSSLLTVSSGSLRALTAADDEELTLSEAWLQVFGEVLPRSKYKAAGMLVANAYRAEFEEEPPSRRQFVDGAPRNVKSYGRNWLITTLRRFKDQLGGSQS